MDSSKYLYLRQHPSYDEYDIYKLGVASDIKRSHDDHISREFMSGKFIFVICVDDGHAVEQLLRAQFSELHKRNTGGDTFYDKQIKDCISPYLTNIGYAHRVIAQDDIDELVKN